MFREYSMTQPLQLAPFMGFTSEEVKQECARQRIDYAGFKAWYDGYRLSNVISEEMVLDGETIDESLYRDYETYCPFSVVNAMLNKQFANYWNQTETYEALHKYIEWDFDGLARDVAVLMDGGRVHVDIAGYQNDMTTFNTKDDILTMLVHLGYLAYDSHTKHVFIPNREVHAVFETSTRAGSWDAVFRSLETSRQLLEATWAGEEQKVADSVEQNHNQAANKTYNNEAALSYAIQLAYYAAQKYYTTILELDSGQGYVDICYLPAPTHPDIPALLVEIKYEAGVETALDQIRRRDYPQRLEHYRGRLLLVGISYDRNARGTSPGFKHHTCKIEQA